MDTAIIKTFKPSQMQVDFFHAVRANRDSVLLTAVAGAGKSTSIVEALVEIPEHEPVAVLAFNKPIADEMKQKVEDLRRRTGRSFRQVRVSTFHSLGFGALCRYLRVEPKTLKSDAKKVLRIAESTWPEEDIEMYGDFCSDLVGIAKGQGVGVLCSNDAFTWMKMIEHHDLQLASQDATYERAIELAQGLLQQSNVLAKSKRMIDYDDMLYLVLLWRISLFPQARIFVDEAQDTNPVRRAMIRAALRAGGKVYAVGDRGQAIFGFTGASHDAMDLIKSDFRCIEMPLTVSYRCPKAIEPLAREVTPAFRVHPGARQGQVLRGVDLDDALKLLEDTDVILCRNLAPLVSLAYSIMARGRGCRVLGSEIGSGLIKLVKRMRARRLEDVTEEVDGERKMVEMGLRGKLYLFREREVADAKAKGEDRKAEAVTDRVACVETLIDNLDENSRTVPALIKAIEGLFADDTGRLLQLATCHKAKGREWMRVAVWMASLMPSPWARQEWQYQQERNLQYVRDTRAMDTLMFLSEKPVTKPKKEAKK